MYVLLDGNKCVMSKNKVGKGTTNKNIKNKNIERKGNAGRDAPILN